MSVRLLRLCRSVCTSRLFFFLAGQIRASIRVGLQFKVLSSGPGLDNPLTQALKLLRNTLFNFIGFHDITFRVISDVEDGLKLGLKLRVAMQAVKKVLRVSGWRFCVL